MPAYFLGDMGALAVLSLRAGADAREVGLASDRDDAAEVAGLEPVAIALEREDLGVVDESVDHRGGGDLVAEDFAHAPNGLLEVTIRLPR